MDGKTLAQKIKQIGEVPKKGWTPLAFWAEKGEEDVVKALLEKDVDPDGVTTEGVTPLQYAAQEGHAGVVLLLLEHGAEIDSEGTRFSTALMRACNGGHLDVIRILLEKGADLNYEGQTGDTALMNCIAGKHLEAFKLLLNHGVDINFEGEKGRGFTPLMFATFNQQKEMVRLLLAKGCRINRPSRKTGWTAKSVAIRVGNEEILQMLESAPQDSSIDPEVVLAKIYGFIFLYGPILVLCSVVFYLLYVSGHIY
eukprot:Nk52_evm52s215 gene=Nk52_evmTU52s215